MGIRCVHVNAAIDLQYWSTAGVTNKSVVYLFLVQCVQARCSEYTFED